MGIVRNNKLQQQLVRVMLFGTFDMIHDGHLDLIKQVKTKFPYSYIIISIARDSNVLKIKGRLPKYSQSQRVLLAKKNLGVDRVVLGGGKQYLPHIVKERPQIIALGYDQMAYVGGLKTALQKLGCQVKLIRLKAYLPHKFKTSLLQK